MTRRKQLTPREILEARLDALGFVLVSNIHGVLGGWRQQQFYDDTTVCWETWGYRKSDPPVLIKNIVSYDTMTDCARHGIEESGDLEMIFITAKKVTIGKYRNGELHKKT